MTYCIKECHEDQPVSRLFSVSNKHILFQFIFSTFIVSGSKQTIYCDVKLQMEIHKRLDPPYEELFDNAEEHALKLLADAYSEIFQEESIDYEEVFEI